MPKPLTRKTAIKKVKKVEDALLSAQAMIGTLVRDLQEVRGWLEGPDKKEEKKS